MKKFLPAIAIGLKVKEQFTSIGFEMVGNTAAQFAAFQQQEYARWKKVIETGKLTID